MGIAFRAESIGIDSFRAFLHLRYPHRYPQMVAVTLLFGVMGQARARAQKSPSEGASSQDNTLRWLGDIVAQSRAAENVMCGQMRSDL